MTPEQIRDYEYPGVYGKKPEPLPIPGREATIEGGSIDKCPDGTVVLNLTIRGPDAERVAEEIGAAVTTPDKPLRYDREGIDWLAAHIGSQLHGAMELVDRPTQASDTAHVVIDASIARARPAFRGLKEVTFSEHEASMMAAACAGGFESPGEPRFEVPEQSDMSVAFRAPNGDEVWIPSDAPTDDGALQEGGDRWDRHTVDIEDCVQHAKSRDRELFRMDVLIAVGLVVTACVVAALVARGGW